ncbi:MAG: carboxylating nicotinate-nucleotide diphosphorylase [Bdellovibrionales bacterium]|nr:carboxylating nicotinate-nucleotide diphosphorylase [Bdellovibrionales bacterium]
MKKLIEELVLKAFQEDIPNKDITTEALEIPELNGRAQLVAKMDLVISGSDIFTNCMRFLQKNTEVKWYFKDGDHVLAGQRLATIIGDLTKIIQVERVALNFLGHLCGIANLTQQFVGKVSHTSCKILDTRKTTPTFRLLEKRAVSHGGGTNHRLNLSDGILVKENHIALAKGILPLLEKFKKKQISPITIEVKNLEEAKIACEYSVKRLLLDNMSNEQMAEIVKIKPPHVELEASGNMNLERVTEVADLGIDYISVGQLTHSAPCADLSLLFEWQDT